MDAGASLAVAAHCGDMDDRGRSRRLERPRLAEISAQQSDSFGILRRPQRDDDLLPGGVTFVLGGMGQRGGLNAELARRAATAVGDIWVVPGNGHIAIVAGGATCSTTEIVAHNGLIMWGSKREMRPNVVAHGVVPDGVAEVTLFAAREPLHLLEPGAQPRTISVTVSVSENVYGAMLPGEFLVGRFSGPAGTIEFGPWSR